MPEVSEQKLRVTVNRALELFARKIVLGISNELPEMVTLKKLDWFLKWKKITMVKPKNHL
jgi:hypothetical protein